VRDRIATRVALVGAAQLVAVVIAAAALLRFTSDLPWARDIGDLVRYAVERVLESPGRADRERAIDDVRTRLRIELAVWDDRGACLAGRCDGPAPRPRGARLAPPRWNHAGRFELWGIDARGRRWTARADLPPPTAPRRQIAVMTALALGVVALGAAALAQSFARPLRSLRAATRAFGAGDLSVRVQLRRSDEFGDLARTFDEMADRVDALVRAERDLLANISHELRTPLARIRVALELGDEGGPEASRESLGEVSTDLAELERIVDDVLDAARLDAGIRAASFPLRRERIELADLAARAVERLRARDPSRPIVLAAEASAGLVDVDAVLVRRALENLLHNACRHSPPSLPVRVRVWRAEGAACVAVEDRGEGLAPDDLARVGTPFFRADRSRTRATGGVGLGVSLTRRIAEAHGGSLSYVSAVGEGTVATLTLPRASDEDGR
jgi:two-component system, OmpR family, sensor kinase